MSVIPFQIDTLLGTHNYDGKSRKEATGFIEKQIIRGQGATFRVPLKAYNPDRDALVLFINGVFLQLDEDYTFDRNFYTVALKETLTQESELVFVIFKSVKRFLKYDSGSLLQDGSVHEHKLSTALKNKLIQPTAAQGYLNSVAELKEEFGEIAKAFAAFELSSDVGSRIDSGAPYGDYFKSSPLQMNVDLFATLATTAATKGAKSINVETVVGVYSGQEVTIYDRSGYERVVIDYITGSTLIFKTALKNAYVIGAGVARSMGYRDPAGALRFGKWKYPVTNDNNYYPVCDVRYTLYKSDEIVAWVKAAGQIDTSLAASFKTKVTYNIKQTNSPLPNIRWLELTPSLIRLEASAPVGFIQSVTISINGEDPVSLGSDVGFYSYNVPQEELRLEYNDIKVVVVNSVSGTHQGTLVYEKRFIEEFADCAVASDGKERCFTAESDYAGPVSLRLSMTYDANSVSPENVPNLGINYILGGYNDSI